VGLSPSAMRCLLRKSCTRAPWERRAPAWLLDPGWSLALSGIEWPVLILPGGSIRLQLPVCAMLGATLAFLDHLAPGLL
jgi:hypothetical protein